MSLLLALPMFFVLMGLAIKGCGGPCGCPDSIMPPTAIHLSH
ncbi:MAG TPA: hypothetical protein VHX38_22180 [Pseudonocardiaceae bacterium]|jgi:hypothetical protein|nr:hypothetical protein [Pseudonocardiaceae bacterium]